MRYAAARFGVALALTMVAAVLCMAALGFWLWSIFVLASGYVGAMAAGFITGLFALSLAGGVLWVAFRLNR